jgi:hypothetical protein
MTLEWRVIPGHESYSVSNYGDVLDNQTGLKINQYVNRGGGYKQVKFGNNLYYVHRLVLMSFVGPPNGLLTRHLNGDPADNRLDNLRWGTAKENSGDALAHGTIAQGRNHRSSYLTPEEVNDIRLLYAQGYTSRALGRIYGVSGPHVCDIASCKNWNSV